VNGNGRRFTVTQPSIGSFSFFVELNSFRQAIILLAVALMNFCLNLRIQSSLQREANQLKATAKVVVLGIGLLANQAELNYIASTPQSENVIRAQGFSRLTAVTAQLRNATCTGQ